MLSRGVFFDEVPPEKNVKLLQYGQEAQAALDQEHCVMATLPQMSGRVVSFPTALGRSQ